LSVAHHHQLPRDDTAHVAGRLADDLQALRGDQVFQDASIDLDGFTPVTGKVSIPAPPSKYHRPT
jgi:hypothetical protein